MKFSPLATLSVLGLFIPSVGCGRVCPGVTVREGDFCVCPEALKTADGSCDPNLQAREADGENSEHDGALDSGQPPARVEAHDDHYFGRQDVALTVPATMGVLRNDVSQIGEIAVQSGEWLTDALGTVRMESDGRFRYTPVNSFWGHDSFLYSAMSGTVEASASVTVSVAPGTVDLSLVQTSEAGFVLEDDSGETKRLGSSVTMLKDFNGDGIPDIAAGALGSQSYRGRVVVLFGSRNAPMTGTVKVQDIVTGRTPGLLLTGASQGDWLGYEVAEVGDFNADGIDDLGVVASQGGHHPILPGPGQVYVIYGRSSDPGTTEISLEEIGQPSLPGIRIESQQKGKERTRSLHVARAGDINLDGIADLLVGDSMASSPGLERSGRAYVVFGSGDRQSGDVLYLQDLKKDGFAFDAEGIADQAGSSVAGLGDINNDGLADFAVGAARARSVAGARSGRAYVIYGTRASDWSSSVALGAVGTAATRGFILDGETEGDAVGLVRPIGDFNADGVEDMVVGACEADPGGRVDAGRAYVIYGKKRDQLTGLIPLAQLPKFGFEGFTLNGSQEEERAAQEVRGVGDLNGDGTPDLAVASPAANAAGRFGAGRVYVLFGSSRSVFAASIGLAAIGNPTPDGIHFVGGAEGEGASGIAGSVDLNGDGVQDLAIGSPSAQVGESKGAGRVYGVYGVPTLP